jgi:hypothetical protein
MKDEFRFMNGKQTLEFLKAGHFTHEQAMKAQANEKAGKRRPDVLKAFGEYVEWLDAGDQKQLELKPAPVEKSKGKSKEA